MGGAVTIGPMAARSQFGFGAVGVHPRAVQHQQICSSERSFWRQLHHSVRPAVAHFGNPSLCLPHSAGPNPRCGAYRYVEHFSCLPGAFKKKKFDWEIAILCSKK